MHKAVKCTGKIMHFGTHQQTIIHGIIGLSHKTKRNIQDGVMNWLPPFFDQQPFVNKKFWFIFVLMCLASISTASFADHMHFLKLYQILGEVALSSSYYAPGNGSLTDIITKSAFLLQWIITSYYWFVLVCMCLASISTPSLLTTCIVLKLYQILGETASLLRFFILRS